jgi:hypothetical protein
MCIGSKRYVPGATFAWLSGSRQRRRRGRAPDEPGASLDGNAFTRSLALTTHRGRTSLIYHGACPHAHVADRGADFMLFHADAAMRTATRSRGREPVVRRSVVPGPLRTLGSSAFEPDNLRR